MLLENDVKIAVDNFVKKHNLAYPAITETDNHSFLCWDVFPNKTGENQKVEICLVIESFGSLFTVSEIKKQMVEIEQCTQEYVEGK